MKRRGNGGGCELTNLGDEKRNEMVAVVIS